jgi:hypothetical protein
MTNYDPKTSSLRKYALVMLTFFGCGLITLYIGSLIGHHLFLVRLYGHSRVSSEHLHFVEMLKGKPWVVSNGDKIADASGASFLYVIGSWFVLFFATYPFIYRFIPEPKSKCT